MSFKSKLRKKANLEQRVTLQAKHDEKIEYFEERKYIQDNKREELETLKEHISKYNNIPNKNLSVDELNKKLELSDKIMELEDELNNDDTIKEDINYLLDTGSILFSYYNQMNEKRVDKKKKKEPTIEHLKEKTIVDFFQKKDKPKRNEHPLKNVETIRTNNTKDDNNFLKNSSQSKEKMY